MKITIYDNPAYFDRYTVCIEEANNDAEFYGMSSNPFSPQGFNQFRGTGQDGYHKGKHIGKITSFYQVPLEVQKAICGRMLHS